jgi:hypothetical protein
MIRQSHLAMQIGKRPQPDQFSLPELTIDPSALAWQLLMGNGLIEHLNKSKLPKKTILNCT